MARLAFFTLNAYSMLTGGDTKDVGGAQLQQILVGKELASRGHEVFFVEYDTGNKLEQTVDGIQVVLKPEPRGNELRRAATVLMGTLHVCRRIDPDVCYRRVLDFEILGLSAWCRVSGRRFVYGIAHDDELTDDPTHFDRGIKSTRPYVWLTRKAISAADAVVAQNSHQLSLANRRLRTAVYQIPNCYSPTDPEPLPELVNGEKPVVLWVARFTQFKRPDVVIELADELPELLFVMVGSAADQDLYERIEAEAAERANVRFEGFVPFSEIDRYFVSMDMFLNTSDIEGFPNTFLQSWAYHKPVISLRVDPDDVITANDLGFVANGSVDDLCDYLRTLAGERSRQIEMGEAAYRVFQENYTVEAIADDYEEVLIPDSK